MGDFVRSVWEVVERAFAFVVRESVEHPFALAGFAVFILAAIWLWRRPGRPRGKLPP